jgi:predicted SprT family Zn-dependent metalloprotease
MTRDEIIIYARVTMQHHRLDAWGFRFDSHKRRFGVCSYRERYIGVSWPVCQLNADTDIMNTIKHEIAHALTPGAGHGLRWKLQAMVIGAKPQTCAEDHVIAVPGRWQFHCPCGMEYNRYKRPREGKYRCAKCRQAVVWTDTRAIAL